LLNYDVFFATVAGVVVAAVADVIVVK